MKKIIWIYCVYILLQSNLFASLTINWSGVQDISIGAETSDGRGTINIDFDNNGAVDYYFEYGPDGLVVMPQNGNEIVMFDEVPFSPIVILVAERFAANELVNDNLNDPLQWESQNYRLVISLGGASGGISGYWKGADHEYMGVRFNGDDGLHYGWIEMSVSDTYEIATFHSWAYNTVSGEGLITSVVPEPSTITLFIVGILTFGMRRIKWYKSKE